LTTEGLPGPWVNDIAFATAETVFIAAAGNAYRSDDSGATWAESFSIYRSVQTVVASPAFATDRTAFLADGAGRVFSSTDGGGVWEEVGRIAQIGGASEADVWISISPAFPADPTLWATAETGTYRSTDGGLTWEPFAPGVEVPYGGRLVPNPHYPDDPTLEVSTPASDSSLLPPGLRYPPTALAASDGTLLLGTTYGLFRSADGGETWAEANAGLPRTAPSHSAVGIDGTLYGTYAGAVYRLSTSGMSWELRGLLPPGKTGLRTVHTHDLAATGGADTPAVLCLTTYDGLHVSLDEGATWARMAGRGLPPVTFHYPPPLLAANFAESGVAHLAYSGRVHRTDDGGETWAELEEVTGVETLTEAPDGRLLALAWSHVYEWRPEQDEWEQHAVWFGGGPALIRFSSESLAVVMAGDRIHLSEDGGRSWAQIGESELEWAFDYLISPRFDADCAIYAVEAAALSVSTDAGRTWVDAGEGLPDCGEYGGPDCDLMLLGAARTDGGYAVYAASRHDFHTRIWMACAEGD
jgi:photosystem II stability/assembly factor-like uncharacterized protein